MRRKTKELDSIQTVIDNLYFYDILNPSDKAFVKKDENYDYDYIVIKEDGKIQYGEVKKLSIPLYIYDNCYDFHLNYYWLLNNKKFTFEGIPDANDKIDISKEHLEIYKNRYIPEDFQGIPYYYINAACYSPDGSKEYINNKDKLSKMVSGNWSFDIVFSDFRILHFEPEDFKKSLGPYVRRWSTHTTEIENGSKKKSWELKRLISLDNGILMRDVNSMTHSEYLDAVL